MDEHENSRTVQGRFGNAMGYPMSGADQGRDEGSFVSAVEARTLKDAGVAREPPEPAAFQKMLTELEMTQRLLRDTEKQLLAIAGRCFGNADEVQAFARESGPAITVNYPPGMIGRLSFHTADTHVHASRVAAVARFLINAL